MKPIEMAEYIQALLDQVPGARTVFLRYKRASQTLAIESYKTSDPEPDKLRKTAGYYEVGTYTRGAATSDLVADILETMGKIR